MKNFQEHPQSLLLTDSLSDYLAERHPNGDYAIGQDCGIYWREADPPERGAEAPDWFYVPGVPAKLDGIMRRSYVLWRELVPPTIVLEFASGDGTEERDMTPYKGKQWVYTTIIRPVYYGIFNITTGELAMFHIYDFQAHPMTRDASGRYFLPLMDVAIGVWEGAYQNQHERWLRWWSAAGELLLTGQEKAQQEKQRADAAESKADRLASQLRALGIEPDVD